MLPRGLPKKAPRLIALCSVVDPYHVTGAERFPRRAAQAFMSPPFVWINIIANRYGNLAEEYISWENCRIFEVSATHE
jgi:hypothetical protein